MTASPFASPPITSRRGGAVLRRATPAVYFDIRKRGRAVSRPLTRLRARAQYRFEYRRRFRYANEPVSEGAGLEDRSAGSAQLGDLDFERRHHPGPRARSRSRPDRHAELHRALLA